MVRVLTIVLACVLASGVSAAEPAASPEVRKAAQEIVTRWLAAQNQGDFTAYQALYAPTFTGVKRVGKVQKTYDRAGWLADRRTMFRAAMEVTSTDVVVTGAPPTVTIEFTQTWAQGTFADRGNKRMLVDLHRAADPILSEHMLASTKVLAREACLRAIYPSARAGRIGADPSAARIIEVQPFDLGGEGAACRIDTREPEAAETQVVLAALAPSTQKEHKRAGGWMEVGRQSYTFEDARQGGPDDVFLDSEESFEVTTFQAGPQKLALRAEKKRVEGGNMHSLRKSEVGLWRATRDGLRELLSYESRASGGEADSGHDCTVATTAKVSKGWFDLELTCIDSESNWHSEDPAQNGITESSEAVLYRWDGAGYQERRRRSTPPEKR